ncbi:MAG: amidohydrolase family protein [Actinobacteria bacterium]|nr:amidohydrolase family protein [Actinomycetota bacterium]
MRTLFVNCIAHRLPSAARASWVLAADGSFAAIGDGEPPEADRTVDLGGAHVYPSFVDAHVHLPATGLYAAGMDFRGQRSRAAIIEAFKDRAKDSAALLFGGNFEDLDQPILGADLDGAVGERPALLARADMHSAVVSGALLAELDLEGIEGVDRDESGASTGFLREQAAAAAWTWFDRNLPKQQAADAIRGAVKLAYSKGITSVHEMHVVEWRGWAAWDTLAEAIDDMALVVVPYIATTEVERIRAMGFHRIGGDYFLDGSFGSHTAWLSEPYQSSPPSGSSPTGISYREDEGLYDFFLEAQRADLQVGVHAIGDAAIEQAIATWERVAGTVGRDEVRRKGHRIEHFECSSDDHLERARALGLRASVQPAFDLYWGGPHGLYAERMGWERAREMNRFGSMIENALVVGAGSDSTVTPLDPFVQMQAMRAHHLEGERLGRTLAIKMHTMGARALAFGPGLDGTLEAGAVADLVALDRDLAETEVEDLTATEVLGTWAAGTQVWPPGAAESE